MCVVLKLQILKTKLFENGVLQKGKK